jgi:SSS family solute:Na+ symporter
MVLVEDFYRHARPKCTDKERLVMARTIVVVVGFLNVGTALILVQTKGSALAMWFAVSAIASGGLAGLFFLAFLARRATSRSAWVGIACSTVFTIWAVLTKGARPLVDIAPFNYGGDDLTIGVCGNIILFGVGLLASRFGKAASSTEQGTFWHWRSVRQSRTAEATAGSTR